MTKKDNIRGALFLLVGIALAVYRCMIYADELDTYRKTADNLYILITTAEIAAAAIATAIAFIRLGTHSHRKFLVAGTICAGAVLLGETGQAVKTAYALSDGKAVSITILAIILGGYTLLPLLIEAVYSIHSDRLMYTSEKAGMTIHQRVGAVSILVALLILCLFEKVPQKIEMTKTLSLVICLVPVVMVLGFIEFCQLLPPKYNWLKPSDQTYRRLKKYQKHRYSASEYHKQTGLSKRFVFRDDIEGWTKYAEYEVYDMLEELLPGEKKFLINVIIPSKASIRHQTYQETEIVCFWRNRIIIVNPKYDDDQAIVFINKEQETWRGIYEGRVLSKAGWRYNLFLQNDRRKRSLKEFLVQNTEIDYNDEIIDSLVYNSGYGLYEQDKESDTVLDIRYGGYSFYWGNYKNMTDIITKMSNHCEGRNLSPKVIQAYEALKEAQKPYERSARIASVDMKKCNIGQRDLQERYIARCTAPDEFEFYRVTEMTDCRLPVYYEMLEIGRKTYRWKQIPHPKQAVLNQCEDVSIDVINEYVIRTLLYT